VQLSSEPGTPEAWSPDGSKLLVLGEADDSGKKALLVLNADGTETHLGHAWSGADFTADGSQVVYDDDGQMYVVGAEGGTPELLGAVAQPLWTLSPDGTQIAYIDWGHGDGGHSVRVMNSDRSDVRVVVEDTMDMGAGHIRDFGIDWSPDGQHLAFANTQGIFVIGVDGSGLRKVSSGSIDVVDPSWSVDPHWSPDGSLISYNTSTTLVIARSDGTQAQEARFSRSGPWHPGVPAIDEPAPSPETTTPSPRLQTPTLVGTPAPTSTPAVPAAGSDAVIVFAADPAAGENLIDPLDPGIAELQPQRMDLYVTRAGQPVRRIVATDANERCPVFSPDGAQLAYMEVPPAVDRPAANLVVVSVDVSGIPTGVDLRVPLPPDEIYAGGVPCPKWSPDGTRLAYLAYPLSGFTSFDEYLAEVRVATLDGDEIVVSGSRPAANWTRLAWSPDGDAIAYAAVGGVWRATLDGSEPSVLGTADIGEYESWWPTDGSTVVTAADGKVVVKNEDGSAVEFAVLHEGVELRVGSAELSPDGDRAVALVSADDGTGWALATCALDGSNVELLTPWSWALNWAGPSDVSWQPRT
jgi:Tol biopolymer transport system component